MRTGSPRPADRCLFSARSAASAPALSTTAGDRPSTRTSPSSKTATSFVTRLLATPPGLCASGPSVPSAAALCAPGLAAPSSIVGGFALRAHRRQQYGRLCLPRCSGSCHPHLRARRTSSTCSSTLCAPAAVAAAVPADADRSPHNAWPLSLLAPHLAWSLAVSCETLCL